MTDVKGLKERLAEQQFNFDGEEALAYIADLEAKLALARVALRPFVQEADDWGEHACENLLPVWISSRENGHASKAAFSLADLANARTALNTIGEDHG